MPKTLYVEAKQKFRKPKKKPSDLPMKFDPKTGRHLPLRPELQRYQDMEAFDSESAKELEEQRGKIEALELMLQRTTDANNVAQAELQVLRPALEQSQQDSQRLRAELKAEKKKAFEPEVLVPSKVKFLEVDDIKKKNGTAMIKGLAEMDDHSNNVTLLVDIKVLKEIIKSKKSK